MTDLPDAQAEAREIIESVVGPRGESPLEGTMGRMLDKLEANFATALQAARDENARLREQCYAVWKCDSCPNHIEAHPIDTVMRDHDCGGSYVEMPIPDLVHSQQREYDQQNKVLGDNVNLLIEQKSLRAQLAERVQLQDKIKSLGCQCDLDVGFICNTCNHKEVVAENDRLRAQLAERDAENERLRDERSSAPSVERKSNERLD